MKNKLTLGELKVKSFIIEIECVKGGGKYIPQTVGTGHCCIVIVEPLGAVRLMRRVSNAC